MAKKSGGWQEAVYSRFFINSLHFSFNNLLYLEKKLEKKLRFRHD
jgi:hypothetical protein